MRSKVRFALAVAGIAALIVAAAVLSTVSNDGEPQSGREGASALSGPDAGPLLRPGKLRKISVRRGETVRFRARSTTGDELHVHGYDLYVALPAGETVSYRFKARNEGVFAIELHSSDEQVAELRVNP